MTPVRMPRPPRICMYRPQASPRLMHARSRITRATSSTLLTMHCGVTSSHGDSRMMMGPKSVRRTARASTPQL